MYRASCILAATSIFTAACNARAPLASQSVPAPAVAEVEAACAGLAQVDTQKLARLTPDWERFERFHAEGRAGLAPLPSSTASIVFKLAIPGGSIAAPYGTSVFAALQPDGRWLVSHVRMRQLAPPPQPTGTPPLPAGPERIVTTGVLTRAAARRIAAAIASECYRQEPTISPVSLPLRNGQSVECPPDAGQPNALEIIQNGNSRRYLRECGRTWATGLIIITLENPANIIAA